MKICQKIILENNKMKIKIKSNLEILKSIRNTWGNVNPTTKVIKDKTKYTRKIKHKGELYK